MDLSQNETSQEGEQESLTHHQTESTSVHLPLVRAVRVKVKHTSF